MAEGGQPVATTRSDVVRNVHFRNMRAAGAPPPRVTPVHRRYKHTCLMVLPPPLGEYLVVEHRTVHVYACTLHPVHRYVSILRSRSPRLGFLPKRYSKFFRERKKKKHRVARVLVLGTRSYHRGCWLERGLYGFSYGTIMLDRNDPGVRYVTIGNTRARTGRVFGKSWTKDIGGSGRKGKKWWEGWKVDSLSL